MEVSSVPTVPASRHRPVLRREPRTGWVPINLRELWEYRELLYFYAVRDIKVRYKQTALGIGWALLQPVLTMLILSLFLGRLMGGSSAGVPYPVLTVCALLPWQLFSYALTQSSNSLVQDAEVLRKVYFPRLVLPMASVIAGLLDFAVAFLVLLVVMAYYGLWPGPGIVALPLLLFMVIAAALTVGFWLSALNVQYRDVRYTIPFLERIWFFATPIAYPATLIPREWQTLYGLNPMVGVIEGFRWAFLNEPPPPFGMMAASLVATLLLLVAGLFYFRRLESRFADLV
jgi:lipopolysaccharide transport system permease protein